MNERYIIPNLCRRSVLAGALLWVIAPLVAQDRRLVLVVQDRAGAVIAGATVELLDKENKVLRKTQTNQSGEAIWSDLPLGDSIFRFAVRGFKLKTIAATMIGVGEKRIEVTLDVVDGLTGFFVTEEKP